MAHHRPWQNPEPATDYTARRIFGSITRHSSRYEHAHGASVTRITTADTIGSGSAEAIVWNSALHNDFGFWDSGAPTRFTVPAGLGGVYVVQASVALSNNATGQRVLAVRANGSGAEGQHDDNNPSASLATSLTVTTLCWLEDLDYVEAAVIQTSGGNLTTSTDGRTRFKIARIGFA